MKTYTDLASRRFQILADFEEPVQATIFHRKMKGGDEPLEVTTEQAQKATGVGSLKMNLLNSDQYVIARDSPESEWSLYRDWSHYHLLLFSVFSPRELGGFVCEIRSGQEKQRIYRHPPLLLSEGWNLVRIDLGDTANQINLEDIRELRFFVDNLSDPVVLYLDDVVLADNERLVHGTDERKPGDLYVRTRGRRLVAGAAGRFELVFHRGRIVQWFDLAHDSSRRHNLAGAAPLGPNPVALSNDAPDINRSDSAIDSLPSGLLVDSQQNLEEATPLRVVIRGEWRFGQSRQEAVEGVPGYRWLYFVYRDGRVYASCSVIPPTDLSTKAWGLAFACADHQGFIPRRVEVSPELEGKSQSTATASYALFTRPEKGQADLLIVPHSPLALESPQTDHDRLPSVFWRMGEDTNRFSACFLLRLWPADLDTPEQAGPIAMDYCHPLPIEVDVGQLVLNDEGDDNQDGFNESSGCYVLQLKGNLAKVRIDGRRQLRFSPAFKLKDVLQRDVWVYVDGRQVKELCRDSDGDILFIVSGAISDEVLVEVTSAMHEAPK